MDATEIVLLVAGGVIFVISFLLPKKKEGLDEESKKLAEKQMMEILEKELDRKLKDVQSKIDDVVDDTISESADRTERKMERLSNEKMMAINEYADTVLEDINKNHKEVLFLYDMLNDKHTTTKNTVTEVQATINELTQTAKDIEISAKEASQSVNASKIAAARAEKASEEAAASIEKAMAGVSEDMQDNVKWLVEQMVKSAVEDTAREMIPEAVNEAADTVVQEKLQGMVKKYLEAFLKKTYGKKSASGANAAKAPVQEQVTEPPVQKAEQPETQETQEVTNQTPPEQKQVKKTEKAARNEVRKKSFDFPFETFVPEKRRETRKSGSKKAEANPAAEEEPVKGPDTEESSNEKRKRILELHKAGKSDVAIAKELEMGVGEVKLVIDLFKGM